MRIAIAALAGLTLVTPARADTPADNAAGLLFAIGFVDQHCPAMEPNPPTVRGLFHEFGYELEMFTDGGPREVMVPAAKLMTEMEKVDPDAVCRQTWKAFGPTGTMVPGVFKAKG